MFYIYVLSSSNEASERAFGRGREGGRGSGVNGAGEEEVAFRGWDLWLWFGWLIY